MSETSPPLPEASLPPRVPRGAWISETDVWKACSKLAAQRIPVTTPRVRKELGDRGSNSTINRFINTWKAASREHPEDVAVEPASPAPDQLREPMQLVWDRARLEVREEVAAEREALSAARQELDERHQRDQKEIETVRLANDQLQALLDRLEARLAGAEKAIQGQTAAVAESLESFGKKSEQASTHLANQINAVGAAQKTAAEALTAAVGAHQAAVTQESERAKAADRARLDQIQGIRSDMGEAAKQVTATISTMDGSLKALESGLGALGVGIQTQVKDALDVQSQAFSGHADAVKHELSGVSSGVARLAEAQASLEGELRKSSEARDSDSVSFRADLADRLSRMDQAFRELRDLVSQTLASLPPQAQSS